MINVAGDVVSTFNEGGLSPVTDWSGQSGRVNISLTSTLTKPYQFMFQKVVYLLYVHYMFKKCFTVFGLPLFFLYPPPSQKK